MHLQCYDIALIPLVSLTSPPERIKKITAAGEGFIYAVTVNGITGVRDGFDENLGAHLTKVKRSKSCSSACWIWYFNT